MKPHFELFRFALIRGPRPSRRAHRLRIPDPVPGFLANMLNGASRDDTRTEVARYLGADTFEPDIDRLTIGDRPIEPLRSDIKQIEALSKDAISAAIPPTLRMQLEEAAGHADVGPLRNRLASGIIALKFRSDLFPGLLADYVELFHLLALLQDANNEDPDFGGAGGRVRLQQSIALPALLFPHLQPPDATTLEGQSASTEEDPLDESDDLAVVQPRRPVRIGSSVVLRPIISSEAARADAELGAEAPVEPFAAGDAKPPTSVGLYRPALLPLFVTRQQIKRYEGGEIAHIENVLRSEHKQRDTRRLRRLEETFKTEEERRTHEERDHQSTDKLDLQSEVQSTVSESVSKRFGVSVSAGYGPYFTVSANYNQDSQSDFTRSQRFASAYARDVTEKTAYTVSYKIKESQTTKIIEEFEEKNQHGFDNRESSSNIRGVYQWIDKIYENQVFNYGLRLIFVLHIPEPATFLSRTIMHVLGDDALEEPEPFTHSPWEITSQNYQNLVKRYGVSDFDEPPAGSLILPYTKVDPAMSAGAGAGGEESEGDGESDESAGGGGAQKVQTYYTSAEAVAVPPGYRVSKVRIATAFKPLTSQYPQQKEDDFSPSTVEEWNAINNALYKGVRVTVGTATHHHSARDTLDVIGTPESEANALVGGPQLSWKESEYPFEVEGEQPKPAYQDHLGNSENEFSETIFAEDFETEIEQLPILIKADFVDVYAVRVEVRVVPGERAWNAWRISIHNAISEAYRQRLAEYRERVAELETSTGISISGRNPLRNREIEQTELKRHAIRLINNHSFGKTGVEISENIRGNYPSAEAFNKGRYADFFETAIDWRNMTYDLHPYYWARRQTWIDRLLLSDTDPEHARFLKCGSATVRVPIDPEFEFEVLHFLEIGEVWAGGDEAPVVAEQNIALLDEINEYREMHGEEEVPEGLPFSVRLPTTLVGLRPDDDLPSWSWNEEAGEWVADEEAE